TVSLAPVSEMSSIVQSRRQVPSMPIICAEIPRSNVTRSPFRRSATMTSLRPQAAAHRFRAGSALRLRENGLTTGKLRGRRGNVSRIPHSDARKHGGGQWPDEIGPDSGLMLQILRLAVAPVE